MTIIEKITLEVGRLPLQAQQQVLVFVESLKQKEQQALEADMDAVIAENLAAWKELAK